MTRKLTQAQVDEIRARYAAGGGDQRRGAFGITQQQLAKEYGVSAPTISQIVRGWTWASPIWKGEEGIFG